MLIRILLLLCLSATHLVAQAPDPAIQAMTQRLEMNGYQVTSIARQIDGLHVTHLRKGNEVVSRVPYPIGERTTDAALQAWLNEVKPILDGKRRMSRATARRP